MKVGRILIVSSEMPHRLQGVMTHLRTIATCMYVCRIITHAVVIILYNTIMMGNFGEQLIWQNGPQMVLAKFKLGNLNTAHHI